MDSMMSMSMSMPMSSATTTGSMSMATGGGHSHSDMSDMAGMGDMSGMQMDMSQMAMVFFTSTGTPLFSHAWTPMSTGAYAGTCIFLIALSLLLRLMLGVKSRLEARWHARALRRARLAAVAPPHKDSVAARLPTTTAAADEQASHDGHAASRPLAADVPPFQLNVDLLRALFVTVLVGVAYLLMLAVMTMNVGYFMSVLAGAFLGELLFGRWNAHGDVDHH